ncbi:MAG: SDR family NAD(P)-dependent oxidoreductase, partial [Xanthobacteraceae bacterium]
MSEKFGKTDDELATMPLTFRDGLFAGQVVLVSGAGRGIGKAIAFQFARLGAKLVLCGRDVERLEAVAGSLSRLGAEVLAHPMSIRDPDAVARLFDAVAGRFKTIDVLVNNAGGQFPQAAIDFAPKGWSAVIETNLTGTWYMMQQAARRWRDAGRGGRVANI